jgi:sugar transferase EpsL
MKRLRDILLTCLAMPVLALLMLVIGLVVLMRLGTPVLFQQQRAGLHGSSFTLVKFRTMSTRRFVNGTDLPDAQRIEPLGRFLRATSLDELPELWNVLRGEMSLVGPRPLLPEYLRFYTPEQARRHDVRPGLTGWAQINGRNAVFWPERFRLDIWYIENASFRLDLYILMRTVFTVFGRRGINWEGELTMPPFRGDQDSE